MYSVSAVEESGLSPLFFFENAGFAKRKRDNDLLSNRESELSISKTPLEEQVLELCDNLLNSLGFRVVDIDCRLGGRSLVRVFVERLTVGATENTSGRAPTIDDCALISRQLGEILEAKDLIPGGYDLEVSSPGLDRRLRLESDFQGAMGREIKLKLAENLFGTGLAMTGHLVEVSAEGILVSVPGGRREGYRIPIPKIKQAKLIWRPGSGLVN